MKNINVTKRDGTLAPFNANLINQSIEEACIGLKHPISKVVQIASETQLMLYDGITTAELEQAVISATLQNITQDIEYDRVATRLLLKINYKRILGNYQGELELKRKMQQHFPLHLKQLTKSTLLDPRMTDLFDLDLLAATIDHTRDDLFLYAGASTLLDRYSLKDAQQLPLELPQYFFMRVAMGLSYHEEKPTQAAINFYDSMSKLEYLAGGSTNIGAGTPRAALSNCFLLEIQDDIESIATAVSDVIKISKSTGGIGASITKLRASGSPLTSNNTTSSGPTPFAKIIDTAIRAIQRGGKKKGALAFYMENWHLDFPDFLNWRHNAGDDYLRMRTANTAVFLSDEFMRRALAGEDWYMFDPAETADLNELYGKEFSLRYAEYIKAAEAGKLRIFKKAPAAEQYRQILVMLQTTSHPWLVWKDTINNRALNNNTGTIHMSNLCTEITLPQDREHIAVCNLASINLVKHLNSNKISQTENLLSAPTIGIDWDKLAQTTKLAVRHLDNLIDINILPIPAAALSDQENRAIGLGVMGFAELLENLGLVYDSAASYDLADQIFEFISYHAILESTILAQKKGSYPNFAGSGWSKGLVPIDTLAKVSKSHGQKVEINVKSIINSEIGKLDWAGLRIKVAAGMRHATLMAVAPNANIGLVAGTTPGIDPRFTQVFARNKISGKYMDINHHLVAELEKLDLWEKIRPQIIASQGDIANLSDIPASIRARYKTAFTTDPLAFIEVAARAQKWVDQALSRNMYLESRDIDETMDVYTTAWKRGLKSTYYLHMKPRHTAEQSTVEINKRATSGRLGFGGLSKSTSPQNQVSLPPQAASPACPIDPQERLQCDSCQ